MVIYNIIKKYNMKIFISLLISACLFCLLHSCLRYETEKGSFNDRVIVIENNPQLYLSKLCSADTMPIKNSKDATEYLLSALAQNYINEDCYPQKAKLEKAIKIFKKENLAQQQLEALFLLAHIYKNDKELDNEIHTIENAIEIADKEKDNEWLFHLYSYLGEMYIQQFNSLKFVKYQTLANLSIKDMEFQDMTVSAQIQVIKNMLNLEQYQKAYDSLLSIESNVSQNSVFVNEIMRLKGIALFRMHKLDACIETMEKVLKNERSTEHKFTCHSILTYCYYQKNDMDNAKIHKQQAMACTGDKENGPADIEFYELCAKVAGENNDFKEETECLYNIKSRYETALDNINGQSLDKAIQAYTHIHEKKLYNRRISLYRYILFGLLVFVCIGLLLYIRKRKKQVYRILALQQQIDSLENLQNMKDEMKGFIQRDFEIAKKIAMLRATQKAQSEKFLKDLEKHHIIEGNDLLATHWDQFYKHIDIYFDGFFSKLTNEYPALNEKEIQLCCMLVSGFKTEEIAAIWMNSVFSVHKYKTNVRKKINAPEGADIIAFLKEKIGLQ